MPMRSDERLAQRIAEEVLPELRPSNILDIGCGDGIVSGYLPESCRYQGLDINTACIYEQKHDNPHVQYIEPESIPGLIQTQGPWDTILLLDVIEHTRDFTGLFELSLKHSQRNVLVSLPNELFILDRLRMLKGQELNAHSLDRLKDPEGFKHQFIININKARSILNQVAIKNRFELTGEVVRPLVSKSTLLQPALWGLRALTRPQTWSMGSIFIFRRTS
jgi:SAM-dependent methyltransferase